MRPARLLVVWLLLAGTGLARAEYPPTGSTGYGLTVFQGETAERFDVEILGTLQGFGSTGDLILGRLQGGPLAHTGVMQGMSGSPVWVDGELIGAVMSTWAFAKDAIAGIRPIGEMRPLGEFLDGGAHPGWRPGQGQAVVGWSPGAEDPGLAAPALTDLLAPLDVERPQLQELGAALRIDQPTTGLLWSASGFPAAVRTDMQRVLGAAVTQAGAGAAGSSPTGDLAPGDAMAAILVDGDARLSAVGTVTAVDGQTVLGFGHPFLGGGPVSIPMARARVVALLASEQMSFKMAQPTAVVGALLLDRRPGVSGKLGVRADTLPVRVAVQSTGESAARTYNFEVARLRPLLPNLVAWSVQAALLDRDEPRASSALSATVTVHLEGAEPLRTHATLSGVGMAGLLANEVSLPIGLTQANQERHIRIQRVEVDLEFSESMRVARLGQVRVSNREPAPGEMLRVEAELLPYRDQPTWVRFELPVPAHLGAGPLRLHVVDGGTAFREELARAIPRWSYPRFAQIQDALKLRQPASSLLAVLYMPGRSVVVRGVELEQVPGSVRRVIGRHRTEDSEVGATPVVHDIIQTGWVLDARRHVTLTVTPRP